MPDSTPRKPLTPTQLAGHLACQHLTQLDLGGTAPKKPDPRLPALRERGFQHENAFLETLRRRGIYFVSLRGTSDSEATRKAMQEGHGAIVQAPLRGELLFGIVDVLLRVDKPSALGAYSYEPLDTKLALETKAGTILQLCAYAEMLTPLQDLEPVEFHVVTPTSEEHYRTADFAAYFRFVARALNEAALARPETYPDPVGHCDICNYWSHCDGKRRADDHLSLIAGIHTGQVQELFRQGFPTLAAVARSGGRLITPPSRGSTETFERLGHQARLQLAARTMPLPPVDLLPVEPGRGLSRLPEPSPGDVFLDFEGDPFVGDGGLEYLTGIAVHDGVNGLAYENAWAFSPEEEERACQWLIEFLMARLADHPALHIYHFGSYEPATLKRLCGRHDTCGEDLDRLLRGGRFVDLHAVVREGLRIGVERYGLKDLEPLHGFRRQVDLRDASKAKRDFEMALELDDQGAHSDDQKAMVLAYNRDDCLSTAALRDWLEEQREALLRAGTPLSRPALVTAEPTEAVGERDRRILELKAALMAAVPADPAERLPEQTARALLAAMLGYFRQEEKNAWWEHFRLREVPADEQLDEREMLAGLEFVETLPLEKKQRSVRNLYRFPPQETAVDVEDKCYFTKAEDPDLEGKSTSVSVADLNLEQGNVVLTLGKAAAGRHPTAVFREQVIGTKVLEDSLLAFATHVLEHGFEADGTFGAAAALLLQRPPSKTAGPLRRVGEGVVQAAERLCLGLDFGVLPVQGPPGSGKTYTAARAILALSMAGKTIGITAGSHKVIDNLLAAVREAAAESQVAIRLVHKHDEEPPAGIEYVDTSDQTLAAIRPGTVVGATAWLWSGEKATGTVDYLFVDEAGQMALAQALAASRAARNLVLLGDPQQLQQPTKGAHPDGADVAALVHVVGPGKLTLGDEQGLFLDCTYRLHPAVCRFTSDLYYERRLSAAPGRERQELRGRTPCAGAGLFLVEVSHQGNQAQSNEEVEAVVGVVASLLLPGTTWVDHKGAERPLLARDVLVVAPYNAQVAALRRRLLALGVDRVGTVDKFQGQEAPVVIYSATSSSAQDAPRGMPFLYDPHRFNVATSRAQGVVVVVASPRLFEAECKTPEQMRWANGMCRYREMALAVRVPVPTERVSLRPLN
jgi:predicted RecB family nuclease